MENFHCQILSIRFNLSGSSSYFVTLQFAGAIYPFYFTFESKLRQFKSVPKISHLIFQSRQLLAIFAAFFKKWLFYRRFCIEPNEGLTPSAFKHRNHEFSFPFSKSLSIGLRIGRFLLPLLVCVRPRIREAVLAPTP